MLPLDDPFWSELRCRWGTASGTSVLVRAWAKSIRCTEHIWEDIQEEFLDGNRVWSAGFAVAPHLTFLASKSIGTRKSLHLMFAAATLLHHLILDGGRIKGLSKVLPIGDTAFNKAQLNRLRGWVIESQVEGKALLPHLTAIPRTKKNETEDLLFTLSVFDGFPTLIELEFPQYSEQE